jgi:DNA-binding protein HU-beta
VNKAQLIDRLSTQLGSKKAATDAVDGVLDHITRAVAGGERVALTGFGVFEKVARPARTGRNPRTGASVKIKKTSVPKFKAGQSFKDVVRGAKKLPKAATATVRAAAGGAKKAAPAKKTTAKKAAPAKRTAAKKAPAKRAVAKKTVAKKAPARKASPAKKTTAKKTAKKAVKR